MQPSDLSFEHAFGRISSLPSPPLDVFGAKWASWLSEAAAAASCPVDFVVAVLLATASATIGNARWAVAWPGWEEPPHLWCASIGESGQGKSAGADIFFRHIIPAIEKRMRNEADFQNQVRQSSGLLGDAPTSQPRFMENDLTIEKVAALLATSAPKGLLMARDELSGWLLGMNRFGTAARAFWLEAYGGRPYRIDRIKNSEPIQISRLVVAWHGGIQPSRLSQVMKDADDGLLARFMLFWPDPVAFQRPHTLPDIDFALSAFERLGMLEPKSHGRRVEPIKVPLCEVAAQKLESFGRETQNRQGQANGLMASALGKARGLALRLSLVLEFLRWAAEPSIRPAPQEITEDALLAAVRFIKIYAIPMAERVYGGENADLYQAQIQSLARWILKTGPSEVHVRFVQRHARLPKLTRARDIHNACQSLVSAGWLTPPPPGSQHGRARQAYKVCPHIKTTPKF